MKELNVDSFCKCNVYVYQSQVLGCAEKIRPPYRVQTTQLIQFALACTTPDLMEVSAQCLCPCCFQESKKAVKDAVELDKKTKGKRSVLSSA